MSEPTKETSEPVKEKIDMDHFMKDYFKDDMDYFMDLFGDDSEPVKEKIDMDYFKDGMDYFMEHFDDEFGYELISWD